MQRLRDHNQELEAELKDKDEQLQLIPVPTVPDYEAVRDRIVRNWRVAKGPEKRERIKEALDKFIEAIKNE